MGLALTKAQSSLSLCGRVCAIGLRLQVRVIGDLSRNIVFGVLYVLRVQLHALLIVVAHQFALFI